MTCCDPQGSVPNRRANDSLYRYTILIIALGVLIFSFSLRLAWGNAGNSVALELHLDPTTMGAFVSAFYAGYIAANAASGFIVDRIGAQKTICIALIPFGAFTALFGRIQGPAEGLILQGLMGLSAGAYFSATTKVLAAWFRISQRGLAFGILGTASSISVIIANAAFPLVIAAFSWRTLYLLLGAAVLILEVACLCLLRNGPEMVASTTTARSTIKATVQDLLGNRNFVLASLAGLGGIWGTWGFSFWVNSLLTRTYGSTPIETGKVVALFGICGFIGKPIYGFLSDLLGGRRRLLIAGCLAAFAILLFAFGQQSRIESFRAIAPFLGVVAFAYGPLITAMVSELVEKTELGAAAGISNSIIQIGAVVVPVVIELVFQHTGSFSGAVSAMALGPLFGAMCALLVRESHREPMDAPGRKPKAKRAFFLEGRR